MNNRSSLQSLLEQILGSRNVYYQPPESLKINYPAIIFSRAKPDRKFADNQIYLKKSCYEIILIDKNPDSSVISKLEDLPYSTWDRKYISDNLNHDVFTLYY